MKAELTTARRGFLAVAMLIGTFGATARAQAPAQGTMPYYARPVPASGAMPPMSQGYGVRRVQATPADAAPPPPSVDPTGRPAAPGVPAAGLQAGGNETDLTIPRAEKEGEPTNEAAAEEAAEAPDETKLLMKLLGRQDSKLKIYGWLQQSYTGNTNGVPPSGLNFGVNPNFLANRYMLNQFYIILEKAVEQTDEVNFGFRFDTLLGNDWQFNYMQGFLNNVFNNNRLGLDLPQFYAEMHVPDNFLGTKGIDFKAGRFYTLAGYEVVPATGRPLLSVPYMFNYGQPFTHMGVLSTWHVTDKLNVYNGVINGWDRFINQRYKLGYIGGFAYTFNEDKTSLAFTAVWGPNQFPNQLPANQSIYPTGYINIPSLAGLRNNGYTSNDRVLFTTVLTHKWTDQLTQVIETDQAYEQNVPGVAATANNPGASHGAGWYSFGNWFLYKFSKDSDKLTGVWRSEIFRDNNGARTGFATNFSEFTLGLIYKPVPYLWIRPEARYDFTRNTKAYNDGTRDSQFTIGLDAILLF